VLKLLWAAPASAVGIVLAALLGVTGGRACLRAGVLEVTWRSSLSACPRFALRYPFRAITLGHVVLAFTHQELEVMRAHELAHVRQYELWGPFFLPAYAASSAWQLLRGRDPYMDNWFEVQARWLAREAR
jgi:hypothetical protein